MTAEFNFKDLIQAGSASRMALERDIRELAMRNPPSEGRIYGGQADYLSRHGLFYTGRELPDRWAQHRGPPQRCFLNAMEAALAEPELTYCEGLYMVAGEPVNHGWCVDPLGELVELTFQTDKPSDMVTLRTGGRISGSSIALTPAHWSYVGVTFDVNWVQAHFSALGLPILDPFGTDDNGAVGHGDDRIFRSPYSSTPFAL